MKILISIITCLSVFPSLTALLTPEFAAVRDETLRTLTGFIKFDTSNPPGYETKAAEYLKAVLDREGIARAC